MLTRRHLTQSPHRRRYHDNQDDASLSGVAPHSWSRKRRVFLLIKSEGKHCRGRSCAGRNHRGTSTNAMKLSPGVRFPPLKVCKHVPCPGNRGSIVTENWVSKDGPHHESSRVRSAPAASC
jgi:hypothetical protein